MDENFGKADSYTKWRAVNDGVMGGRSSGGPSFENGYMVFKGNINTDGGGFSSVRADVTPGQLSGAIGLSLRVKSDGRNYKITLRTDERYNLRPVSFQVAIPQTPTGKWSTVSVQFDDLVASVFGRSVMGATFNKSNIKELGIILADGRDGAFRLDIDWIKAYAG
ncbi:MAG: CIA30 family protein [Maricaulaceae bacterium]